jgi:hypothetical protein
MEKLATFRVQDDKWASFQALCKEDGSNASKVLIAYIDRCIESGNVAIGESVIPNAATLDDVTAAIEPLRDELAELREALGKSKAA